MKSTLKLGFAAAVVVLVSSACAPAAVAPSSAVVSPPPVASPSPAPTPSHHVATLTVAGTEATSSPLGLTVELPPDWQAAGSVADIGTSSPPAGMAFVVTLVDNTFADPCSHRQQSPKVGPTVEALAKALGEVPNTTATKPVQTTIAGHKATYIELAIPASLPCQPSEFYLWQDSPDGDWWVQGLNETARVWILEVGGKRVAFLAHSYPGSGDGAKAEFQKILDSVVFDVGS